MVLINNVTDIQSALLKEIGLAVDADHNIIDLDYGNQLFMHGKNIKVIVNGVIPVITQHDILFDPINNPKLMNLIFNYHIQKLQSMEGMYFSVFYPVYDEMKARLEIKGDEYTYSSKYYYNECLRYIDLIFQIRGDDIDLSVIDQPIVRR
ncbi:MAG: hypothetical protein ACRCXT_11385 [Paraclostridium sp.]